MRRATAGGDRDRANALRGELRQAQRLWDESLARLEAEQHSESQMRHPAVARAGAILPAREQVHQALTLLGAPAAPRLIVAVHDAFYPAGGLASAKLTSLRRDEERSFKTAPYARPYYICAALTSEHLAPARGLLAVSTWPMRTRIIGPLSPRVDYLTAAIRIAQRFQDLSPDNVDARRLLWRFAANIPRAATGMSTMDPGEIVKAAESELALHERPDSEIREAAAKRARDQLDDVGQLFGSALRLTRTDAAG